MSPRDPLPPLPDGRVLLDVFWGYDEPMSIRRATAKRKPYDADKRIAVTAEVADRLVAVSSAYDAMVDEVAELRGYKP